MRESPNPIFSAGRGSIREQALKFFDLLMLKMFDTSATGTSEI